MKIEIDNYLSEDEMRAIAKHQFAIVCQSLFRDKFASLVLPIVRDVVWSEVDKSMGGSAAEVFADEIRKSLSSPETVLGNENAKQIKDVIDDLIVKRFDEVKYRIDPQDVIERIFRDPVQITVSQEGY